MISKDKRILLADDGTFPAGTVLYLDDSQAVTALLTPEGEFYLFQQGTSYSADNSENQIHTAYRGVGSGTELDLIAYLSPGSQQMLHEVMTGLYMAAPGEEGLTFRTFDASTAAMSSFYADADYFWLRAA